MSRLKLTKITLRPLRIIFWIIILTLAISGEIAWWIVGLIALYGIDFSITQRVGEE